MVKSTVNKLAPLDDFSLTVITHSEDNPMLLS